MHGVHNGKVDHLNNLFNFDDDHLEFYQTSTHSSITNCYGLCHQSERSYIAFKCYMLKCVHVAANTTTTLSI